MAQANPLLLPGLSSPVPTGLNIEMLILTHTLAMRFGFTLVSVRMRL
jgi:hypothetical protein